jgi:beta-glucosidase
VLDAQPEAGTLAYSEGLLVGYRGFDRQGIEPLFCFGHGLGYTEWTFESLEPMKPTIEPGHDVDLVARLRNSGTRAGREVVQVYVDGPGDDAGRPLRTLVAFASVAAEPGESVEARLNVPGRAFARFDDATRDWVWHAGSYTLRAGRSSRDLRLEAEVTIGR